ncbi:hypothetical protein HMPREF0591_1397 [Mycobacterium parascrofulaceum ATCC BAA-614]|uniref:Uncharacterized protein n=1 Tax=Mycobacterium parascrofulaceum ATCC BAA-614 TaxID=525368 RepID=D5P5F3_9MYCO|nr:hypothetical protein HMPREF0591_1397 [Mycobacterium parascrofulaceum ATCC BAA-614]
MSWKKKGGPGQPLVVGEAAGPGEVLGLVRVQLGVDFSGGLGDVVEQVDFRFVESSDVAGAVVSVIEDRAAFFSQRVQSFEGLVELKAGMGFAAHVRDDVAEVVEDFAATSLQGETVAVSVPQSQDEGPADCIFVLGVEFLDCPLARVQGVEAVRGVAPFDVITHGGCLV